MTGPESSFHDMRPPLASLKSQKEVSPPIAYAFQLLKEAKYSEASKFLNQALQAQPKSVIFHILNALTYEKLAEKGDAGGNELASIGYQNAINLDPSNVFAITQLGKLKYREQIYDQAQEHFANALLLKPNDPDLLHELAASSYYAYDIKTALSAIDKANKIKPDDALIHRSAAMIHAAVGDFNTSQKHFDIFKAKVGDDPAVEQLVVRFNDWKSLYNSGRLTFAAAKLNEEVPSYKTQSLDEKENIVQGGNTPSGTTPPTGGGSNTGGEATEEGSVSSPGSSTDEGPPQPNEVSEATNALNKPFEAERTPPEADGESPPPLSPYGPQIVIDCYLLRISEDAATSKGNNILENLAVTLTPGGFLKFNGKFSGSGAPTIADSPTTLNNVAINSSTGFRANQLPVTSGSTTGVAPAFTPATAAFALGNAGSISGRVFAAGITWAGLTYSLNIANAIDKRTELVSRPSLITFLKKPATFFSGRELVLGLSGQYGGTLVKYPVGITLEITPESLDDDILNLSISVEGSLLTSPDPNLTQTVDVGKSRVDTYVKVRLGETLMLGGIYEREETGTKSGFPGLQDVPIVQYFFSNETTLSSRRSIVYMLTPRSPDAVKTAVNRAMTREAVLPHLNELVSRNPDWFNTSPNLTKALSYLARDPIIYYEFRSGDVLPPSWGWELPISEKLQQLTSFLYF